MNKKGYTAPAVEVTYVQVQQLIAYSITSTNVEELGYGGNSDDQEITEAGAKSEAWSDIWD